MARYYHYDGLSPENLTRVRCFVCGAERTSLLGIDAGFRIERCEQCDLGFVNPRPNDAQLAEFYEKYYDPGEAIPDKLPVMLRRGDRMRLVTPGSGGMYSPGERDRAAIQRDLEDGFVTAEAAARDYGIKPAAAAGTRGERQNAES